MQPPKKLTGINTIVEKLLQLSLVFLFSFFLGRKKNSGFSVHIQCAHGLEFLSYKLLEWDAHILITLYIASFQYNMTTMDLRGH